MEYTPLQLIFYGITSITFILSAIGCLGSLDGNVPKKSARMYFAALLFSSTGIMVAIVNNKGIISFSLPHWLCILSIIFVILTIVSIIGFYTSLKDVPEKMEKKQNKMRTICFFTFLFCYIFFAGVNCYYNSKYIEEQKIIEQINTETEDLAILES